VGALAILLLIAVVVSVAIAAVVIGIVDQQEKLRERLADVVSQVEDLLEQSALTEIVETILTGAQGSGSLLRDGFGSTVGSAIGTAGGFVSGTVLAAVLLYYLLKDGPTLVGTVARKLGGDNDGRIDRILRDAAGSIRAYVKGRTILAVVQGTALGIVAAVGGVPLAFTIGVVNLLGAYVPYIGGFIGGAFAVLMALSVGGIGLAMVMMVAAIGISVGLENLLEPALLGNALALHPIVVLFATVTGGLLVGVVGMFLAAPLVAIGRMLFRELADTGFFAADPPVEAEPD
jgi:predicted PurR-regulated permease PerM